MALRLNSGSCAFASPLADDCQCPGHRFGQLIASHGRRYDRLACAVSARKDIMDEKHLQGITDRQVRAIDYAHDHMVRGSFQWPTNDFFTLVKHDVPDLVYEVRQLRRLLDAHGILAYREAFNPDRVADMMPSQRTS